MSPYPSPTGRPSTGYNTKPISSFFTPHKKPEEEKNDRPKIAVKNVLKSNNLTTLYNPIKKPGSPFSLSRSNSNSSSTENLADNLARFRFDSDTKSPLRDLNSPTSFRKLKQRLDSDSEESADENMDASPQRILRARKPIKKPAPLVFSSDEEEEEEEEEVQGEPDSKVDVIKKRKIFSDSEDDNDDDPLMDDDEVYVDQNEVINKSLESTSEQENIERVQRIHPNKSVQEIQDAIRHAGSVVAACKLLMSDQGIPKQKRRRLVDEDDQEIQARKQLSERQRELLVLKYFNTCTAQDLQEVTGCKSEAAEKITEQLRPFADMDDLEEKLKRTKGTSVKYIQSCQEMMDGYTAVDQIIEKIENLGSKLRYILNIWEGASRSNSPTNEEEDEESQPGMNMTNVDIDVRREKSDPVYKDAMDGYLTEQPNCVDEDITLKDYQILGVNWMLLLYRKGISGILADEMGLGKTCQVITFLGRLNELGDSGPHLIVVPSSTIENWVREFERFCPDLEVRLYHGSINERAELRAELKYENKMRIFQVILTTYQIAAGHIDDRTFLRKLKCRSMILDEGHMVKNCASGRYARLMNIQTPFRLLLTGTPLQNSLQELVSLLIFIMPETFANHEEEVRSIFKIRAQSTSAKEKDKKRKDETSVQVLSKARIMRAKKMMTPFVLRRKKQDVLKDIPNKTQIIERCTMTENQAQVYSDIILNSKKSYEASLDDTEKKSDMKKQFESMTNIVIHLRKAADHPLLFRKIYTDELLREMAKEIRRDVKYWDSEEEYIYEDMTYMSDFELHNLCRENRTIKKYQLKNEEWMDSGKIERLKTLLPECKKRGNKVLIFSQFTKMLDILENAMATIGASYVRLDGETKVMERQNLIDEFNNNKDLDVFLLSTKAGGFGINLTSANVVILYDLDFNPQNDKQAEDRAHRVGQTKEVFVHKLIAEDSIEEYILKMAEMKLKLDKNVSSETDGIEEEEENKDNQKKSLQAILKEAFRYDSLRAKTSSRH